MFVIDLNGVSFNFGSESILHDIRLKVPKGDFLAILGPNGSGKTTLLKIILGLLEPSSGTAKIFGSSISEFKDWSKIGYVPQNILSIDQKFPATVREVVSTGVYSKKGFFKSLSSQDWCLVDDAIALAGLTGYAYKQIGELSGGQQQKAFIAKAMVSNPELLVFDEPTSSIDQESEHEFYSMLSSLNKAGVTVLIVSHDIGLVSDKVKTILCIDRKTLFHGDSKSFKELVRKNPGLVFSERKPVMHHHHQGVR